MEVKDKLAQEKTSNQSEAIYQILVMGEITGSLLHVVDDMQIRLQSEEGIVSLVGWLPDQSALIGLLNALNNIRQKIVSVRILSND
jgi:hypothetical protein